MGRGGVCVLSGQGLAFLRAFLPELMKEEMSTQASTYIYSLIRSSS